MHCIMYRQKNSSGILSVHLSYSREPQALGLKLHTITIVHWGLMIGINLIMFTPYLDMSRPQILLVHLAF